MSAVQRCPETVHSCSSPLIAPAGPADTIFSWPAECQRQSKIRQWGNSIRARIERRKRAPRNAGVGQVLIVVSVDAAGQLRGVRVRQSSGNPVLDEAALDAARRAGKFPKAPVPLDSNYAELTIPIVFSR